MSCEHEQMIKITEPTGELQCEDCVKQGDTWVHLRMCMTCGYIGCCDSSKNKHARKHYFRTGHPIIRSVEPGENWRYCFIHKEMLEA